MEAVVDAAAIDDLERLVFRVQREAMLFAAQKADETIRRWAEDAKEL